MIFLPQADVLSFHSCHRIPSDRRDLSHFGGNAGFLLLKEVLGGFSGGGNGEEFLCLFSELMAVAVHIKSKQVSCSIPPFFLLSLQVSSSGWVPAWRERECSLIPTYQGSVKGANWWYWWVLGDRGYRECALLCQHCRVGWISWEWNISKGRWNNRGFNPLDGFSRWEGGIGAEQLHCSCVFLWFVLSNNGTWS